MTDDSDILDLEALLQPEETAKEIPPTSEIRGSSRTTRGVDNSSKYTELLPRKSREEREGRAREIIQEEPIQVLKEVLTILLI